MKSIGGSVFVRNAIKYDYCIKESIVSLLGLCEQIVVLDCQSDDGTTEMLSDLASDYSEIDYKVGVQWECAPNYARLAMLANQAISHLKTEWHFMIQADEVLHEQSHAHVRNAIETAPDHVDTFLVKRLHVWGGMDTQLRHDLPTQRKPAGDAIIRLGRLGRPCPAHGDGEGLIAGFCDGSKVNDIVLFHYGFVRQNEVQKVIDMQTWFHGPGSQPDERVVEMQKKDGIFRPEVFFNPNELCPLYLPHPSCAVNWVDTRRHLFTAANN